MFEFLENNDLGDLNRYRLLMNQLEAMPEYRNLVHALREERGNGRNDYPDETMARVLIVKNLFQLGTCRIWKTERLFRLRGMPFRFSGTLSSCYLFKLGLLMFELQTVCFTDQSVQAGVCVGVVLEDAKPVFYRKLRDNNRRFSTFS